MSAPVRFWGTVVAVRPRLVLAKFEGETDARCPGHLLVMEGTTTRGSDAPVPGRFVVAIGPATMRDREIRPTDLLRGDAHPVEAGTPDVVADLYRVGVLRVIARGPQSVSDDPPRTDPPLTDEAVPGRARRALPMAALEDDAACGLCPHATVACVVVLADPRDYRRGEWHRVPACLGPEDCPHYAAP